MNRKTDNYSQKYLQYKKNIATLQKRQLIEGNSYIISGAISLLGGTLGNEISKDQTEQLAYSAFQSIGVASIGYGLFKKELAMKSNNLKVTTNLLK